MDLITNQDSRDNTIAVLDRIYQYTQGHDKRPVLCIIEQSSPSAMVHAVDDYLASDFLNSIDPNCRVAFRYKRLGIDRPFDATDVEQYGAIIIGELVDKQDIDEITSVTDDIQRLETSQSDCVTLVLVSETE